MYTKFQKTSYNFSLGSALSNRPHINSVYLIRIPSLTGIAVSSNFFWKKDVKETPKAQVLSVKHCVVIVNYLQCKQPAKILEMVGKRDLSAGNGTTAHATVPSLKNVSYSNLR